MGLSVPFFQTEEELIDSIYNECRQRHSQPSSFCEDAAERFAIRKYLVINAASPEFFCSAITSTMKPTIPTTRIQTAAAPIIASTVLPVTDGETTTSGSSTALIIGIAVAVTVLCFLAISIGLYCKKKKGHSASGSSGKVSGSGSKTSGSMSKSVNSTVKSPSKSAMSPGPEKSKMSKMSKMDKKEKKTKMSQLKKMPKEGGKSQMADTNEKSDLRSKNLYSTMK